ncbi:hypothetical protein SAMN05421677_10261 [Halobacillus aidingensis]|uniref:Uncharacterized protein n=1 Tax=Halobacillus aidingensis TaxID=240303 RepID=A0A1H0FN68_HALAD|nr:hypothetical protein SAMN05421677_10261 [Halobacillus aidingensis]
MVTIRQKIHMTNLILFVLLLAWGFLLYFGTHFVEQDDPYVGENLSILLVYVIWGLGYFIQLKQPTMKRVVAVLLLSLGFQVLYFFSMYYVITFFEWIFE